MKKRKLSTLIIMATIFSLLFLSNVSKASVVNAENDAANVKIKITNPVTDEVWITTLPAESLSTNRKSDGFTLSNVNKEELSETTFANINLTKAIEDTLTPEERAYVSAYNETLTKSGSQTSDITITASIKYISNAANNTIALLQVFGNYGVNGIYYPTNRKVYWANTNHNAGGQATPTTNSWSYTTDSTPYGYNSWLGPYVLSECDIAITGMGGTRHIEILVTI